MSNIYTESGAVSKNIIERNMTKDDIINNLGPCRTSIMLDEPKILSGDIKYDKFSFTTDSSDGYTGIYKFLQPETLINMDPNDIITLGILATRDNKSSVMKGNVIVNQNGGGARCGAGSFMGTTVTDGSGYFSPILLVDDDLYDVGGSSVGNGNVIFLSSGYGDNYINFDIENDSDGNSVLNLYNGCGFAVNVLIQMSFLGGSNG